MANDLFNKDVQPQQHGRWLEWAIPAAASLVGTLFTNKANSDAVEKQNAFNEQMMDKQNAYNSPANQKALYQAAGVNPAFLFGGQSGLDSTSGLAQSAGVPHYEQPDVNSVARNLFESKRLQNETLKNEADIDKLINESESVKIANKFAFDRNQAEIDEIKSRRGLNDADRDLRIAQKESELQRKEELFRSAENLRYNAALLKQKAKTEGWTQKRIQIEYERMFKMIPVEINALKAKYNLDNEQAKLAKKSLDDIESQIQKRVKEGGLIDAQSMGIIIDNTIKDASANAEIIESMIRADNPLPFILLDHTNGWAQNAVAESFALRGEWSNGNFGNYQQRARRYKYDHYNNGSSWLFRQ